MSSILGNAQQIGTIGVGTANQLQKSLAGHPDLLHFLDPATSSVLLQCDAILSETHSRESSPTSFPIESGAVITDHLIVSPFSLSLQGVISDTPIGDKAGLITEAVATGLTAIAPPLGVAAAGAGYSLLQASLAKNSGSYDISLQPRSVTAFETLIRLQQGFPDAVPPEPPKSFDVKTRYRRYPSMVIQSLSIPRDQTISGAIVFQLSLVQMIVVAAQSVDLKIVSNKALAAARADLGEKDPDFISDYQRGRDFEHAKFQNIVGGGPAAAAGG